MSLLYSIAKKIDSDFDYHVLGSGISKSVESYNGVMSFITIVLVLLAGFLPWGLFYGDIPIPHLIVFSIGVSFSTVLLGIGLYISLPLVLFRNRGARLRPFFLLFTSSLATRLIAGSGLAEALLRMYEEELEDLKEYEIELRYIASMLRSGKSLEEVLSDAAKLTPSIDLRTLFVGLSSAAYTGTGVLEVLSTTLTNFIHETEARIEHVTRSLGALLEVFVATSVMVPVAIGVVGLLLVFQPIPGLSFDTLLFIATFLVVPAISITTIIIADTIISRVKI